MWNEMLNSNYFSKNKKQKKKKPKKSKPFQRKNINFWNNFLSPFWIYVPVLVISFFLHINLMHKVRVDLINERQHKTQGFLGKISKSHGISLSRGQWVLSENYNYLNPTELLDLCCSVVQFIPLDCDPLWSITR